MQKHTTFIPKEQSRQNISQLVESTKELHDKLGDICYLYDKDGIKLTETNTYQFFINHLVPKNSTEKILYNLILRAMYQMEVKSGSSAYFTFLYALNLLRRMAKDSEIGSSQETTLVQVLQDTWSNKLRPLFEQNAIPTNEELIKSIIATACSDNKDLSCALTEAVFMSGLEGRIFVESGKQSNYIVELKSGYTFKAVEPFKFLLDNDTSWFRNQVRVMVLDGMIEEVSEIDKLLNKASETKQPLLIIANGFGEEVAATCKMNNDKGNTDVQLLRFSNDVWSLNVTNDIAIVCGTTPISSLQGHVISMVEWNDLPVVDRVQMTLQQTNIENAKTQHSVLVHMKTILDKKKDANTLIEDIQNVYDARLKALAANAVYLHLPLTTEIENKTLRIMIDNVLRNIKATLQFGSLNLENLTNAISKSPTNSIYEKALLDTLHSMNKNQQVPLLTIALGTLLISKMCLMISNSSGFVESLSN